MSVENSKFVKTQKENRKKYCLSILIKKENKKSSLSKLKIKTIRRLNSMRYFKNNFNKNFLK